jgi:hypothetical protein
MSTISAGTTSGTALNATGDTTGSLVLQTNGTTTAMTISTAQVVSLTSSLALLGATSGSVAMTAPAVAGTQAYTLPSAYPTAAGQVLSSTTLGVMSWATSGGSPGGSTTQVQYNNAGAFGGVSGFTTDGTRVTASTTIGVGGATPSTSGSGITFPATASISSNANTLDDYEEGTWTPAVTFGGGSTGITYSAQGGTYTKIGNTVRLGITIDLSSKGSSTGRLAISGVPFTTSQSGIPVSVWCDKVTVAGTIQPYLYSDNNIYFLYLSSGTATNVTNAEVVNTSSLYVSVVYPTAA